MNISLFEDSANLDGALLRISVIRVLRYDSSNSRLNQHCLFPAVTGC